MPLSRGDIWEDLGKRVIQAKWNKSETVLSRERKQASMAREEWTMWEEEENEIRKTGKGQVM